MTKPYDDDAYIQWNQQFNSMVGDFLDTEGNTVESLRDELEQAIENSEPVVELHVPTDEK